ncbi:alpha/beta fold hydrolase, partial [Methylobacterium crusticola]
PADDAQAALRAAPGLVCLGLDAQGGPADPAGTGAGRASGVPCGALPRVPCEAPARVPCGAPARVPCGAPARVSDGAPAYLFFTSGSTGTPKAVLGSHGGLAHFLAWQRETFGVGAGDRCAQLTGLSFDVVLRDVFLPLVSGATLVLPPAGTATAEAGIPDWLERQGITRLHTVPSVAEAWLAGAPRASLPALRHAFFAGEPLAASLVARWRRAFPGAGAVVNLYGPTETTLAKCHYVVPPDPCPGIQPLGAPLPQSQVLVLGPAGRPCGLFEPGEIAVRTPFRSLGYWDDPEETARRFVANPWGDDPDDRLYLTGDRGVIGADGLVRFLGRLDDQVKVRGVRVEPAEVAAALRAAPGVGACAVLAREDAAGVARLAAYVVPEPGAAPSARALREHLRLHLPAPMIPEAFAFLDALPLSANQKLDRARLPAPEPDGPEPAALPRDAVEWRLAEIWRDLLGTEAVGIADDFFDLGGHSLLALRLLVRIEQALGRKVPLAALFEGPTIRHLAAVIRRQPGPAPPLVRLRAGTGPAELFLVHTGGGTVLNYLPLVRRLAPGGPVDAVQARGLDGEAAPHRDLVAMAADYVAALRALRPAGPYRIGGHSLGGVVAYEMARQLAAAGESVALLALFDPPAPHAPPEPEEAGEAAGARLLAGAASAFERFTGRATGLTEAALRGLPPAVQVARAAAAFERAGLAPVPDGEEGLRRLLAVAAAHRAARRAYRPPASPVAITLFRAADGTSPGAGPWAAASGAPVREVPVPGDHVTMMAEPHAGTLAERLGPLLGPDA